jgi:hypothetical protein
LIKVGGQLVAAPPFISSPPFASVRGFLRFKLNS